MDETKPSTRIFRGHLAVDVPDDFCYWEAVWMVPTEESKWWATPSSEFPDVIQWVETRTTEHRWVWTGRHRHRSGRDAALAAEWSGNNYGPPNSEPSNVSPKTKLVLRCVWDDIQE